ncbi:two component transcriptional regulator, LuxR family [Dyadobacter soli]|uniref:Two component transcriptional regulator, LuxR family n=1 Tax=Dyadobacter soli TaxID=659014 RepID=A0A1G7Y2D4_9BACT|nr:response regulator transcription factor [Dyadobacter soli]SDG90110.1 two component transcriptional regulator, LuxR family [Dyadobacter soli]
MNRLAIIEDTAGIRQVLSDFFAVQPDFELILSAASFEEFVDRWNPSQRLDLLLCDIGLPGRSGIEAVWHIKESSPQTQVMMFTVFEDQDKIFQSLCAGATGYMLKSSQLSELRAGLREMLAGGAAISPKIAMEVIRFFNRPQQKQPDAKLTVREIEILSLLQSGFSNKDIGDKLFISVETVKYHIKNIYIKLQISSRSELLLRFRNPLG